MDDLKRNITFDNVQVAPNGDITGKVSEGSGSEEAREFRRVFEQMNEHFNNDQMVSIINYNPRQNELCACKFASQWHRVRVEYILSRKNGQCASCVFVDEGSDELVPVKWLRQLPAKFQQVPFQVKRLYLHGIQPISMVISEDVIAVQKPVKLWDEAAVKFMHDSISAATAVKCVLTECHSGSEWSVRLYLEKRSGVLVCLNEVLVNQQYAINADDAREELSIQRQKPKKTIEDVIRSRQQKLLMMMNNSDTEMSAKSDTEFTVRSRTGRVTGADRGYETDTLGVSVMSHRAIHRQSDITVSQHSPDSWRDEESPKSVGRGKKLCGSRSITSDEESVKDRSVSQRSLILAGESVSDRTASQRSLNMAGGDSVQVFSDRARLASGLSSSEEDSCHRARTVSQYKPTAMQQKEPQIESQIVTSPRVLASESNPSFISKSPHQHNISSQKDESSHSDVSSSSCSNIGRGGLKLGISPLKSPSSPKVGIMNNTLSTVGRGSPGFGRGSLLSSAESSDVNTKHCDSPLRESDSETGSIGFQRSHKYGRGSLINGTESLNSVHMQSLESGQSPTCQLSQKSPKYGRGALLSSTESLDVMRAKLFTGDDTVRPKQPAQYSASSREACDSVVRPQQYDDGSVRLKQFNDDAEMPKQFGSQYDYQTVLASQHRSSDGEFTRDTGQKSRLEILERLAHSETELTGAKSHASAVNSDDYRTKELKRLGAFDDMVPQSDVHMQNSKPLNPSSMPSHTSNIDQKSGRQTDRGKAGGGGDYSSGCESSASSVSAVAASMLGQAGFKRSRLPKVALNSSGEISDSGLRQIMETMKVSPNPGLESAKKSPTKADKLQTMIRRIAEEEQPAEADSPAVTIPESALSGNKKMEMLGKFTGQKLLEKLGPSARSHMPPSKKKDQDKSMFGAEHGVLVHGRRAPKPILDFDDAPFTEHVKQSWANLDFAAPKLVQAYTWPAIIRGKHVITIAPADSGKTLAYLYPLISGMSDLRNYSELPIGNGPLAIIIAQSWQQAERVYENTCHVVAGHRGTRVVLVHGGGEEDKKACKLINGCEILIVTAPALKRLLEAGYTEVRRLCHLVIDDADQVLKTFTGEMNYLMAQYTKVINGEMKRAESPRQILLVGSQWNKAVEEFLEVALCQPIVIMTSSFEASIYGRVKQVSHMCHPHDRSKEVIGILGNVTDESSKTIIFASTKDDIVNLFQIVRSCSYYCLMVHQEMELYQVEHVTEEWLKELNVLICCDSFVSDMKITNATTVIHFDMPNSKTQFSNRLGCMRQFFYNFENPDRKLPHKPTSHLIITERCRYKRLSHIYEMLQRTSSTVPQKLQDLLLEGRHARDQQGDRYLCGQLLAFGFCRDQWRCEGRHVVIPEIDVNRYSSWIPDEGEVKVLVSHVVDASHYYVRLLSVRTDDKITEDLSPSFSGLQMDVSIWYSNLDNQKRKTAPYVGEVCGYQENEVFYRVQILEFLEMNTKQDQGPIEALVKFVDTGREEEVPAFKLYELPKHLQTVPFQAVEMFMCKLRPMDKDTEWTNNASRFIHDLVRGKTLEGKIVLKVGYILWLDPLVMRLHLGESRTIINKFYVHTELLRNGLAIENENHLKRLHKLCDGKVKIPKALLIKTRMSQILQTDLLPACREYHDVQVSSVGGPDFFFVQRMEKIAELDELMGEIKDYVEMMDDGIEAPEIPVGAYCLAEYTTWDKGWYRGQILSVDEDSYKIFFADYGDKDQVPKDKVREFPNDRFFELPLQAIECELAHIKPQGSQYEMKAGDILWDISHFVNNDLKKLVATVMGKVKARLAGQARFTVELHTKTDTEHLDMSSELVWRHLAAPEDGSPVVHLFPKPLGIRKRISSCLLIPELCAAVYWEQEPSRALSTANEILNIINRSGSSLTCQMKGAVEAVQCIVKLVGRVPWDNVSSVLLMCLRGLASASELFVEEMLSSSLVSSLIHCLEMNSDTILQHQAADFIAKLANVSLVWLSRFPLRLCDDRKIMILHEDYSEIWKRKEFKAVFRAREYLSVLLELLDCTQCEQVQGSVCRAFTALCSGSERVFSELMEMSVCPTLVKYLKSSTHHGVTEAAILLISTLSELDSSHADLKKDSLIEALVKNLKLTKCDKCIQHSVQMCDNFAATRRKHKTFLLELEMVPVLTRLLELGLQPTTKQLCKDLMSSLIVKVPSEPMSGLSIRPGSHDTDTSTSSGVPPQVLWSQNSFNVLLSVKISNVPNRKNIVTFKENVVMFRVTVDEVTYSFTYQLYGNILQTSCKVAVRSQEILISMKKQTKGKWPRLLQDKQKPANLFVDYERFVDSSCESELDDESRPFMLKKKKKKPDLSGPGKGKERKERRESSDGTDTSDSLEELQDPDDRPDYDPFSLERGLG